MSKTTFTLKRKQFTKVRVGGARISGAASPLPTAATSAFNTLPENFSSRSTAVQEHLIKTEGAKNRVPNPTNIPKPNPTNTPKPTPKATPKTTNPGLWKSMSGWGKAGVIGLGAVGTVAGLGLAAKKGIEKAGEQSDGSKLFSQTKKDNMATTYRLKRKTFSEGDEKKSNFGKIALGTAATAGLAFAGARRGMLGTNAMKSTNAMWAKAGNAIGSRSMVQSGAKKYGAAVVKESGAKLEGKALNQAINRERKAFLKQNNMFQAGKTPTTPPAQQKATGEGLSIMRSALNKI